MPKDPKRNLQRYQIRGGHLNEFEFQKSQRELTEESKFPFGDQTGQPGLNQAEPDAASTPEAPRKAEKRRKPAASTAGGDLTSPPRKSPQKKGTSKSAKKTPTPSRARKNVKVALEAKKSTKKLAGASKKTTKQASTKRK
jgi:hypothetical protein